MVFTSLLRYAVPYIRPRTQDSFWRKRRIFKLAAHYQGRKRNCYSIAIRYVHRALVYATKSRALKKEDMRTVWKTRVDAASQEHGISGYMMKKSLAEMNVLMNYKVLADLAIWEPRTFKSLVDLAWVKAVDAQMKGSATLGPAPDNVIPPADEVD